MRPLRPLLIAFAGIGLLALASCDGPDEAPSPADALRAHLARISADTPRPQLSFAVRSIAWLQSAPGQPAGIATVTAMPDVVIEPERVIAARELEASLRAIAGRRYDPSMRAFLAERAPPLPLERIEEMLGAAIVHPEDARMVVDLLTGIATPDPGRSVARLQSGDIPASIRCAHFRGVTGSVLTDDGRMIIRPYQGVLLRFEGDGWNSSWRIGRLTAIGVAGGTGR